MIVIKQLSITNYQFSIRKSLPKLTGGKTTRGDDEPEDLLMVARIKSCDRQEGDQFLLTRKDERYFATVAARAVE